MLPLFLLFYGPFFMNLFLVIVGGYSLWLGGHAGKKTEDFKRPHFLYRRMTRFLLLVFMALGLLQLVPVPAILLKLLSPHTVKFLGQFQDSVPWLTTVSLVPADTLHSWMQTATVVLCFGLVAYLEFGLDDVRELLKTVTVSGLILIVCGGIFYWGATIMSADSQDFLRPIEGRMTFYAGMCLPVSLSIFLARLKYIGSRRGLLVKTFQMVKEDRLVLGYMVIPLVLVTFLALTARGVGLVAVAVPVSLYIFALWYLRMPKPLRRRLKYVLAAAGILVLITGSFRSISMTVESRGAAGAGASGWEVAKEITADFPVLGSGLGTFRSVARLYPLDSNGFPASNAGSDYLEVAAELGVVASIFLVAFLMIWMLGLSRMWWVRRHPDVKILGLGVICGLLVGLMHSFFQSSLHVPPQLFLLGLFMVLGIKIVTYKKEFPVD